MDRHYVPGNGQEPSCCQKTRAEHILEADLGDILKNPHALGLQQSTRELQQTITDLTRQQMQIYKDLREAQAQAESLRAENASLRAQQTCVVLRNSHPHFLSFSSRFPLRYTSSSKSLSPLDSTFPLLPSAMSAPSSPLATATPLFASPTSIPPCTSRSAVCPEGLDAVAIGWTQKDYARHPCNSGRNTANKSRPNLKTAIRHPVTYEELSDAQADSIRSHAAAIMMKILVPLKDPKGVSSGKGRTASWYARHYLAQWQMAIKELEEQEPITTYCAKQWKAIAVFRVVLRRSGNSSGDKNDLDFEDDDDDDITATLETPAPVANSPAKRPRSLTATSTSSNRSKKPRPADPTKIPVEDTTRKTAGKPSAFDFQIPDYIPCFGQSQI
jgi:hypothetical protein